MYPVLLPKTKLNIYNENLKDEYLSYWEKINLSLLRDQYKKEKKFVLHDGPPYANGPIHIGHAENKLLKDMFNKYFWNIGYSTPYILGWDSHGLPIENLVEKELQKENVDKKTLSRQEFWDKCYAFSNHWMNVQKKQFKELGVFAKSDQMYATFYEDESIGVVECVHFFLENNFIMQQYKPILWSYVEKTALAYAEVEYKNKISNSIYFTFDVVEAKNELIKNSKLIVWTTTPWTIPANETVVFNKNFEYVVFENNGQKFICEKNSLETIKKFENFSNLKIIDYVSGEKFENVFVSHPLKEFLTMPKHAKKLIVHGDFVEKDKGSGFVHCAPAHGEEDFMLAKKCGIEIVDLLDEHGYYKNFVPLVGSKSVKEAENIVLEQMKMQNVLLFHEQFTHSYPHSWRSKAPLIYRLTKQWFLKMKELKETSLKVCEDENKKWIPLEGKNRFVSMLDAREDWCISRQRIWGVPLSFFYNKHTGEILNNSSFLKKTREKLAQIGVKNWWNLKISEIDSAYNDNDYIKVDDILDIWFESGATAHYILQKFGLFPADLYLEGSDQHRGWFQSSCLISANMFKTLPWKNLVTHGFCLDGNKQKMSKSIGNVVDPLSFDADLLRIIFATLNWQNDISLTNTAVENAKDVLFRFKNTIKFLIGMFSIEQDKNYKIEYEKLQLVDQWILHQLFVLDEKFLNIQKTFEINDFVTALHEFCAKTLSAFYFDIKKDVLYCEGYENAVRKQTVAILNIIFQSLIRYLSVFVPFFAEYAWQTYCEENCLDFLSVHLLEHLTLDKRYKNESVNSLFEQFKNLRNKIYEKIERQRELKAVSTTYEVCLNFNAKELLAQKETEMILLKISKEEFLKIMKEILLVSKIEFVEELNDKKIVEKHSGQKCNRCKFFHEQIVENLCARCQKEVLKSEKENLKN